jgi:Fuc2NAc and GlcNAc transferase
VTTVPFDTWLPVLTAVLTAVACRPLKPWLEGRAVLDLPGKRRSHDRPVARGGGLAVVTSLVAAWLIWPGALAAWKVPMAAILILGAAGWAEDRLRVAASLRLLVQLAAAGLLVLAAGGVSEIAFFGHDVTAPWLWSSLALVAVVWLINLYNFMDGSDGLAAAQGVWAGAVLAFLFGRAGESEPAMLSLALAGAFAGFLWWNRPPARLFMGDTGSLALGGAVAALAVSGLVTGAVTVWESFLVSALFIVDATATLLKRVVRGERWYTAHRQHAYQRLLVRGWGHGQVLLLYAGLNVIVVLPCILAAQRWPDADTVLAAGLAVVLAAGWGVVQSATTAHSDKAEA